MLYNEPKLEEFSEPDKFKEVLMKNSKISANKRASKYFIYFMTIFLLSINAGCGGDTVGGALSDSSKIVDVNSTIDYSSLNSSPGLLAAPSRDIMASREVEIINIETGAIIAKCAITNDANSIINAKASIPGLTAGNSKVFAMVQFKGDGKILFRQLLGRIPYENEFSYHVSVSVKPNERSTAWALEMLQDVNALKSNFDVPIAIADYTEAIGKSNIELEIEKKTDSAQSAQFTVIESIVNQLSKIMRNKYIATATKTAIFETGNTDLENLIKNYMRAKLSTDSKVNEFMDPLKNTGSVMLNGANINLFTNETQISFNRLPVVYNATATLANGMVTIAYQVNDADSDPCSVKVLYYLSGSTQGLPLSLTRYNSTRVELNTITATADVIDASKISSFKIVPYDGKLEGYGVVVELKK